MKTLFTLSVSFFLFFAANAQDVLQQITAVVTSVDDYSNKLNNQINLGDTISGTLSYTLNVADDNPDDIVGDYLFTSQPYGFALTAPGNIGFETDMNDVNFLCEVVDLPAVYGGDGITFRSYNNYFSVGNAATDKVISWTVNNPDGNNLSSDALPIIVDLSVWNQLYGLTIGADDFPDGSANYFIRTTVVKIEGDIGTGSLPVVGNLSNHHEIFPNPAHSSFTITNADANATLVIEDVNGKIMMSKTAVTSRVDISDLPPGLYVVKIIGRESMKIFKVVKS